MKAARTAVAALVVLTACAGNTPRTNFYTLDALEVKPYSAAGASQASESAALKVSVWQVAIPEAIDRSQMVLRTAPNRVEIADFHRWAEPLRIAIARVLAEDLGAELGRGYLVVPGQAAGIAPDVRIALDVQKLDAVLGRGVTVDALWSIRGPRNGARSGRSVLEVAADGADHAAIAAAYSRAFARLAHEIATTLEPAAPGQNSEDSKTQSGSRSGHMAR